MSPGLDRVFLKPDFATSVPVLMCLNASSKVHEYGCLLCTHFFLQILTSTKSNVDYGRLLVSFCLRGKKTDSANDDEALIRTANLDSLPDLDDR